MIRYLADVTSTKKPSTQKSERHKANTLIEHLGKYSLAALTPELIANFRDTLLNCIGHRGQSISGNTVRLELALLGHLYTVAIQEWGLGLTCNPVQNIRKPSPGEGRDRRLSPDEEKRLFAGYGSTATPCWLGSLESLWRRVCAPQRS